MRQLDDRGKEAANSPMTKPDNGRQERKGDKSFEDEEVACCIGSVYTMHFTAGCRPFV